MRIVHLYSDAFGAGNINMFEEAFHEDAWIFYADADGNLVRCLISECFEEWSQPAGGKANGRVISVTQAGDIANVLLGWDRPDDMANSYVDLHNLIRLGRCMEDHEQDWDAYHQSCRRLKGRLSAI